MKYPLKGDFLLVKTLSANSYLRLDKEFGDVSKLKEKELIQFHSQVNFETVVDDKGKPYFSSANEVLDLLSFEDSANVFCLAVNGEIPTVPEQKKRASRKPKK